MSYATESDLRQRFGSDEIDLVSGRDPGGAGAAIARAISDAAAEIDAYLEARYALPLPTVPPVLARIACDIARYRLWAERAPDEVRMRYEDARRFLEALAKGAVRLGLPEAMQPDAPTAMAAARTGDAPVFSRNSTGSY
ncbi:MAG: DUF1320 domain-containing protein [Tepidimonas sp.]|nr:DUF1320 domain-containing protein [Tepidimonas sp.]